MSELVSRFATSVERAAILKGLLDYREALAAVGINQGFQWIDGSFVEDCETIRQRAPSDVDIVTFAYRPASALDDQSWMRLFQAQLPLFDPDLTKATFKCDAHYIDLQKLPHWIVADTAYFNGLFSHQRDTAQWKGMLAVGFNRTTP